RVHAPSLEELLRSSDVPAFFNIELKTDKAFLGILEKSVAEVVRKTQSESRVLFSSFNPLAVRRLSRLLPEVPRALLATAGKDPGNRIYLRKLWFAPYIRANLLHLDYRFVDAAAIKRWSQRGVPVALWTVNDEAKAKEFLAAGAVSIISDTLH
ncbi:MAG: glycerophosphodiester phosphodiesterase, partial [Bdellovibrio sp.]